MVISLVLAQIELFKRATGRQCLLLLDDLPGELDQQRRSRLLSVMAGLGVQAFAGAMQAAEIDTSDWRTYSVFQVEQGRLRGCYSV